MSFQEWADGAEQRTKGGVSPSWAPCAARFESGGLRAGPSWAAGIFSPVWEPTGYARPPQPGTEPGFATEGAALIRALLL
jgi:hypothetical protein